MPTEQEIQEYLVALNRLQDDWSPTIESQRAQQKGINNLLKWFNNNEIKVGQKRDETWYIEK